MCRVPRAGRGEEAALGGGVPIDRIARGRAGEEAAAGYLRGKGYVVLGVNQRTPLGEMDLVCSDDREVVVVEVKARCGAVYGSGLEAIGPRKARRLRASALWWLAEKGLLPCGIRFDAVVVELDNHGSPCSLEHVKDILSGGA